MTSFTGPVKFFQETGNRSTKRWYGGLPVAVDPDFVVFMDDFFEEATTVWTTVEDSSAVSGVVTDGLNGLFDLAGTASDDTGSSIQTTEELFKLASGKKAWFETKVKLEDADQQDVFVGLTVNFATDPEAVLTVSDRAGFQINDGNASILFKTEKNSTETSTDTGEDASDDTFVTLGFYWDGVGKVEAYVDRILVSTHTTNIPDDENLAAAAFTLNGEATQNSLIVDYIFVAVER